MAVLALFAPVLVVAVFHVLWLLDLNLTTTELPLTSAIMCYYARNPYCHKGGEEISEARGRKRNGHVPIVFLAQLTGLCNSSSSDLFHPPWANDTAASYMNWTKIGYVACSNEFTDREDNCAV